MLQTINGNIVISSEGFFVSCKNSDLKKVFKELFDIKILNQSFVFKGFSEDYVHYLPVKIERGLRNGSSPARVAKIERSLQIGAVLYPAIEEQLLNVELSHPRGNPKAQTLNDEKWRKVLNPYLVDSTAA